MNLPLKHITAEEFAVWAATQELGRFELIDGVVVTMNAERSKHGLVKLNAAIALRGALQQSGLQGQVYGDGMAVTIADRLVHEPDAVVRLGAPLPDDAVLVTDPFIVVDVLSPSTGPVDTSVKLINYFKLPSVNHYLVLDTRTQSVLHYFLGADGTPQMKLVESGVIELGHAALTLRLADMFE